MRTTDFSDYKFRCHALSKLMTGAFVGLTDRQRKTLEGLEDKIKSDQKITDKQLELYSELLKKKNARPYLSAGAKTYLKEIHKQEVFGRNKDIQNKYLDKGIQVEEQSITLYSKVVGKLFVKNKDRYTNEYITGLPDNSQGKIRDIKSSWDYSTFPLYEINPPKKDYVWQLQGYMFLTDYKTSELIYCLVDTPEMIIEDEKRRMSWKLGYLELPEDVEAEIERNMTYSDIPEEIRVKLFKVDRDEKMIEAIKRQVVLARNYLNGLSINLANRIELVTI